MNHLLPFSLQRRLNGVALLLSVIMIACSFAFAPAPVLAQDDCHLGSCRGIRIVNYTSNRYKIAFKLCCNHITRVTDCYAVPAGSDQIIDYPDDCRLLNWRFCTDIPDDVCVVFDEVNCIMKIYYCP